MKIVLTDCSTVTDGDLDLSVFNRFGTVTCYPLTSHEEAAARLADADAVLLNKTVLDAAVLQKCPRLRYIGLFATGYNVIDMAYTDAHGITVCNAGTYSTDAVAQHVFAFLLNHASRVADYNAFVHTDGWVQSPRFSPFVYSTEELAGKKLGIFGFGSIGRAVASIANAFGMRVIVCSRTVRDDAGVSFVPFETLLAESDYLSIHCPLNAATTGIFDAKAFAAMKRGAYFINTARGGVLDEAALRDALCSGHLSGAAIDVLCEEPMRADCVLRDAPNLVITPHVAWAPLQTRQRLLSIVCDNLAAFLAGSPAHVVHA